MRGVVAEKHLLKAGLEVKLDQSNLSVNANDSND